MLQKGNTSQEISARDLLTSLRTMSLVLGLPLDMHLCGSSSNGPRLPTFLKLLQNPHILLTCGKAPPKVVRGRQFFALLTSKCASRQNGVHLFHHLSFHKCSENGVLCPFWLENLLHATFFSYLNFRKCSEHGVLCILTSKRVSRHNSVQFFISHPAKWLRTRRFSEPTFRPSRATNHWKTHSGSRLFYSDSFSSLIFFLLLFSSLLWFFPPVLFIFPYCRKFDF